ncbi:MAG TPA: YhcN/YlaJ family sporulation lipoprotein [Pseudobacteroides sp.]|nr:YhcN/YlaJ family sporulation lipoprotein [Pseudobacteroides sp.]
MRRRFPLILPVLLGVGLLGILLASSSILGRNTNRTAKNNTTQQLRNLTGTDMYGPSPSPRPDAINIIPDYQKTRTGNNNTNNISNNINNITNVRFNGTGEQLGYNTQRADNICKQIDSINGIENVNVVVVGNTALIGYASTNKHANMASTKNAISTKVKQIDNSITNVVIADSKDISKRIADLANNIKNNKPKNQLDSEFNQIMKSLNPLRNTLIR